MNKLALRFVSRSLAMPLLLTSKMQQMRYNTNATNNGINNNNTTNNNNSSNNSRKEGDNNIRTVNSNNNYTSNNENNNGFSDDNIFTINKFNQVDDKPPKVFGIEDNTINYGKYNDYNKSNNYKNYNNNYYDSSSNDQARSDSDHNTYDTFEKINDKYEEIVRTHRPFLRKLAALILLASFLLTVIYVTGTGAYFLKEVDNKRKDETGRDADKKRKSRDDKDSRGKPLASPLDINTTTNDTDRDVNVNGRTRLSASDTGSR